MAKIDLDSTTLPEFERRLKAIPPKAMRKWGTMSLAQMLAHMRITFEVSLEERETKDESRAWLLPVLWVLLFEVFTNWPKGKIKASRQFLDDAAEDVEGERALLLEAMRRFVKRAEGDPERLVLEPMLGRVSLNKWRRIHGIHFDYHLKQFGA
jgi:hypothetical protein